MPRKVKKQFQPSLFSSMKCEIPIEESDLFRAFSRGNDKFPLPKFCRQNGLLFGGDSLTWLKTLPDASVDLVFADPPYNISKAEWDVFESQEQYVEWSMKWISEAARVLKATGTLCVCGFTEILADLKHPAMAYFDSCRWLIWYYKNKANLGNDWGRSHESIVLFRKSKTFTMNIDAVRVPYNQHTLKYPVHPQAATSQYGNGKKRMVEWRPNPLGGKPKDVIEIPTTCNGMTEKTKHPTQKPEELVRKFVLSATNVGDIVLDPFSGSGTTLVVAEQLKRKWLGCELCDEYNEWAIRRIDAVENRDVTSWLDIDRANMQRRAGLK